MSTKTLTFAALSIAAVGITAVAQAETAGYYAGPQGPGYGMPAYPAMPRGDIGQRLEERRAEILERRGAMQTPSRDWSAPVAPMPMDPVGQAMVEQMDQERPAAIQDSSDVRAALEARRQEMQTRQGMGVHPAVQAKRDYYRARQQALRDWFYGNAPMAGAPHGMMAPYGGAPYGYPVAPAAPQQPAAPAGGE